MNEYQWLLLASLASRHYATSEGFDFLAKMYPKDESVQKIVCELKQGKELSSLLQHKGFEKQLAFYIQYLPLTKAISVCYQQKQRKENLIKGFLSKISYQLIVIVAAIGVLILFTQFVLPSMISVLEISSSDTFSLLMAFHVLDIAKNVLIFLIVVIALLILYIRISHRENYLWMGLHQLGMDKTWKILISYRFVNQLACLLEQGVDMNSAMSIMRGNKSDQLVSLMAYHFNEVLLSGVDFEESLRMDYFDDEFYSLCLWGIKEDDFLSSLQDYQQVVTLKAQRKVNRIAGCTQIICYLFIAVIIILAYQVLLLPLDLLGQM